MADGMSHIEHVIVLMLENRSFDNLAGWLYGPDDPLPAIVGAAGPYDGLAANRFWNPANPSFFQGAPADKVYATRGTTGKWPFRVPTADPREEFDAITFQIFGTTTPAQGQPASMLGFLVDYQKVHPDDPPAAAMILQGYSPEQVTMLSGLARSYAISDAWFASAPCQTWPNRSFIHAGTANGRVNNFPYHPFDFDVPTIFNVLEACGKSWAVYHPGRLPSLTRIQFPRLWHRSLDRHFRSLGTFFAEAAAGTLPSYSFIEPRFLFAPDDQHAPFDVCAGELLLQTVWSAVVHGAKWPRTLFLLTYDEHGGCADHVPPPWGAATPDAASHPGQEGFTFDRFGPRVPTIAVSPWIAPGTVFRSSTGTPFDHTSILATLRDWLQIPAERMLPSRRIAQAPTLGAVLNAPQARTDLPAIAPACTLTAPPLADGAPLNDLQRSIVVSAAHMAAQRAGRRLTHPDVVALLGRVLTQTHAARHFARLGL